MPTNEMPMPDQGEEHDAFMERCMNGNESERDACQMNWEKMHPAETGDGEGGGGTTAPTQGTSAKATWYAVNEMPDADEAEVTIYDAIGAWGVSADKFVNDLRGIKAPRINVRLNTPGGDVFDGSAIYNALRNHPSEVVVHIDGVAASAGSFIAMAGDRVQMASNAYLMIHNASGGVMGGKEDMRRYGDLLEKIDRNIAQMYAEKSGKPAAHYRKLMDAETWFTAAEAKADGLVDVIAKPSKFDAKPTKAKFDYSIYNRIPQPVRKLWGIQQQPSAQQIPPAPEDSPRGEPPPASTQEKGATMASENSTAPAQTPAAGAPSAREQELAQLKAMTEAGHFEQGRKRGAEEATAACMARIKAIIAACPGKPQMAIDAYLAGQTAEAVQLAFEAAAKAEAEAKAAAEVQAMEIARLKALIACGGHPGVDAGLTGPEDDAAPVIDAKAQAEREWDSKPAVRKGFTSKERYVHVRSAELRGEFRRQAAGVQA